nr:ribosomal protein S18-alanine N-acetyltransferase [Virgisporangium ochraceum]
MQLEPLRWWHIADLMPLEEDLFGAEKWSEWMFWNELANGHYYRVAVDDDGTIVGYGGLAVNAPEEAWVQNLAVRRDAQRRGLGRLLLEDLLDRSERHQVRKVLLEVAVDNEPAQKLYATYGFEPLAVRRGYYQPSNTDALVMVRENAT